MSDPKNLTLRGLAHDLRDASDSAILRITALRLATQRGQRYGNSVNRECGSGAHANSFPPAQNTGSVEKLRTQVPQMAASRSICRNHKPPQRSQYFSSICSSVFIRPILSLLWRNKQSPAKCWERWLRRSWHHAGLVFDDRPAGYMTGFC